MNSTLAACGPHTSLRACGSAAVLLGVAKKLQTLGHASKYDRSRCAAVVASGLPLFRARFDARKMPGGGYQEQQDLSHTRRV